ncbi:LOW QUALITY PROTEIN: cellobiohydrolase A [Colletotrichum tofieldiae]|nr:LOW QUALITY PROTEIN: cellobiohydrolase A [Colletotrichum tofieldiae]
MTTDPGPSPPLLLPIRRAPAPAAAADQQLRRLPHLERRHRPDAGLLRAVALEVDLLVQLLERRAAGLALLDHPLGRAERGVELRDGRQLQVDHAVGALLDGERRDAHLVVVLAAAVGEVEVALVVRARHPGRGPPRVAVGAAPRVGLLGVVARVRAELLADEAVGQHELPLVRAHLLGGVVPAADAPHRQLRVAALDRRRDAVGRLVGAGEVAGLQHGLPRRAAPPVPEALEVLLGRVRRPVHRPGLVAVELDLHVVDRLVRVVELLELGGDGRVLDGLGPLVEEAVDELLHLRLQRRADAQLVLEHDLLEVLDAARQVLEPARGALQLVGRADVEHQVPVDDGDDLRRGHVLGEQLRVLGLGTAVAGHEDVEALVGGDEAEARRSGYSLLVLGFGALAHTAADTALDLVRRADALVPLLQPHRHADAVADAVTAPRRADAALDRSQRLGVRVPRLHAGLDQHPPNVQQVLLLGAEHVDALPAGDLGVEVVLGRHVADGDELVRGDLAGGHPRDDAVGAVALDVAEETVVGLLQAVHGLVHDVAVPQGGEDAADGGLASFAAKRGRVVSGLAHHLLERLQLLDEDDVVQVGARVVEVGAEVVLDLVAHGQHGLVEDGRHQRHAAAAARAGLGARLDLAERLAGAVLDRVDDVAFRHVVARADLRVVRQVVPVVFAVLLGAEDELAGGHVQLLHVLDNRHQLDVVLCVADHHAAEQVLAVLGEDVLLVHVLERVAVLRAVAVGEEVAEAGDVDAQELQLGAEVWPLERPRLVQLGLCEVEGEHVGHLDAGGDETKGLALPAGALANGVNVWEVGAQVVADDDTAPAVGAPDAGPPREVVSRPHADGEADVHALAILENDPLDVVVLRHLDLAHPLAEEHVEAEVPDLVHNHGAGVVVQLPTQHPAVSLNQLDLLEAVQVHHGLGCLEAEEAATNDGSHGAFPLGGEGDEVDKIVNRAVHENALCVVARGVLGKNGV